MKRDGGRLLHFSEDPSIARFEPHVPPTNPGQAPGVWAIDAAHQPVYWFPRECPRGAVWANDARERRLLERRFHTTASRVQVTEVAWRERMRTARLYVYEFDRSAFEPWPEAEGQWIAREVVVPLDVRPAGDLLALHAAAGVDLRFVDDIWPFWHGVIASGLPFSGVRLRNASTPDPSGTVSAARSPLP